VSQEIIRSKCYLPRQFLNLNETSINFGVGPTNVYASSTAERATQEVSDWKGRITGVPTVDARGRYLPTMFILRHSKSSANSPDQTKMLVISNFYRKEGYTKKDGWELKTWTEVLK